MNNSSDALHYQAPKQLLKNKVILVSGAGDGIGRVAALQYAAHGATVLLLGKTTKKLEKTYDEIEQAGYPKAGIYPINFEGAIEKDYEDMAAAIEKEFSHLDGILHNASELGPRTPLAQYPEETWNKIIQVNATAPFLMTKALLPLLERAQNPSVIFTGSSVGYVGRAYWGAYAVSKAATENIMQIFSAETAEATTIRVNSINPGAVGTKMRASAYPAEDPRTLKQPIDIMPTYLFLMGEDSVGITGQQFYAQEK
ncbi:YciK family oxidoreductase [Aurantivibrio infirmus]